MIPPLVIARLLGSAVVGLAGATALWKNHRKSTTREGDLATTAVCRSTDTVSPTRLCLDGQDLRRTGLPRRNLRGASLHRARLDRLDLRGLDFTGADLSHARLDGADLRSARLDAAALDWASFRGANLDGASIVGARLVEADLSNATLRGTDFRETGSVTVATWKHATADSETKWPTGFDPLGAGVQQSPRF